LLDRQFQNIFFLSLPSLLFHLSPHTSKHTVTNKFVRQTVSKYFLFLSLLSLLFHLSPHTSQRTVTNNFCCGISTNLFLVIGNREWVYNILLQCRSPV
jgi:hypothetical protein